MPEREIDEILLELRGHIAEQSGPGGDVGTALRSLGDPAVLAAEYRADRVTRQAECTASPIAVLHSLLLLRRGSVTGWLVLALAALGYAWALALGAASIEKILSPHDVGLWYRPGAPSLPHVMIDGPGPPGTRELLRMVVCPAGAGGGSHLFATHSTARLVANPSFPRNQVR
jgi:hypothetical protein